MPNWCSVTYKIVGPKKDVNSLYKTIKRLDGLKVPKVNNGFGNLWLGCVVEQLGGNWQEIECRGEITYNDLTDNVITLNMETAWCEMSGFRYFLKEKFPNIEIYYIAEEPGCEVFQTNDADGEYFPETYLLDSYDEPQYFESIEDAADYVSKEIVGKEIEPTVDSIVQALDDYMEEHEDEDDCWYSFHEFEVVD